MYSSSRFDDIADDDVIEIVVELNQTYLSPPRIMRDEKFIVEEMCAPTRITFREEMERGERTEAY